MQHITGYKHRPVRSNNEDHRRADHSAIREFKLLLGTAMSKSPRSPRSTRIGWVLLASLLTLTCGHSALAQTTLADTPVYSASNVPANLMMTLSVEYPTGTVAAYTDASGNVLVLPSGTTTCGGTKSIQIGTDSSSQKAINENFGVCYNANATYLGYFNPNECYDYGSNNYFVPVANASSHTCSGHWSGNMLNWATMTSLDEFRQALTGGTRANNNSNSSYPAAVPVGTTVGDTASLTVLLRSNLNSQSSSGNFPDKVINSSYNVSPSTVVGDSIFSADTAVYFRSAASTPSSTSSGATNNNALGSTFEVSNNPAFLNTGKTSGVSNVMKAYNAEVEVCDAAASLESNCTAYGSNYKPEGLIQKNSQNIRVGAAAYGFTQGSGPANGVVRALLRDNGPKTYNGYGTPGTNGNTEWSSTDGHFLNNPDSGDAAAYGAKAPGGGAYSASGAINYLNLFGYSNGYETYDTIADLYWASLSYYMNVALDSSYYTGMTTSNTLDTSFPVFTSKLNDPIQYTCQSNAIVTIGDSHTWYDTRVPSSGGPSPSNSSQAALAVVNGADAAAYTTQLGNLPLIEANGTATAASVTMAQLRQFGSSATTTNPATVSLGSQTEPNGTTSPTYNMAGLAYFAHTQDIRSDKNNKQVVTTYTVDVLEPGPYDGASGDEIYDPAHFNTSSGAAGPNMYWLAAKYGGFNDVNNNGTPATELTWHTNSSTGTGLYPDNYFPGNRPDLLQKGLSQIFNNVASTASQSASAPGVTSTRTLTNITAGALPYYSSATGYPVYTTDYTPVSWTGDVDGFVTNSTSGTITPISGSTTWDAQSQLDTLTQAKSGSTIVGWNTGRRIVTWNPTGGTSGTGAGVPFRYSSLSNAEQNALNTAGTSSGSAFLNWMRGDKSNEGSLFRVRTHILGDIVDSSAVLVQGASSPSYTEQYNPGYTNFSVGSSGTGGIQNRQPVVYVGANDGMLHAFEADFLTPTPTSPVSGGGSELFAYVPSLLYSGPNGTPLVDGLPALANLNGVSTNNFAHHFYVDRTPQVADVDFTYTSTGTSNPVSSAATSNWNTILVGGLGKGGKGIYALNITSVPTAVNTTSSSTVETSEAANVMWEFTDPDMGYSYGQPLIVKTRKYGWVVLETSGYDNTTGSLAGHGILYVLNIQTGAILQKIDTGVGSASAPAGLAQATAFTQNVADGTIEQVYAGDLLGNVWRFDLSEPALTSTGTVTPAYPAPTLFATLTDSTGAPQPITTAPRIEESTGANDLNTIRWVFVGTGQFLAISDLSTTQQQTMYAIMDGSGSAPLTSGLPITRSGLTADTNLLTGVVIPSTSDGWYYDLTGSAGTGGGTERVVVSPDAAAGVTDVVWTTLVPSSDPCSLSSNIYVTNFSGLSQLEDSNGNPMTYLSLQDIATTSVSIIQTSGGQDAILAGSNTNTVNIYNIKQPTSSNNLNRYNWREILN
jgi:type IV pilus assembly protein PilY1